MPDFKEIDVSELELDRENPRLPSGLKGADEDEILKYLIRKTNIAELVTSIGENDFFPGEAIVVTSDGAPDGKYTVLEGNRRLTALKLLAEPSIAKGVSAGVAEVATNAKNRPTKVPAYEVDSRGDALQYLGFRHVSGVQRWDPLAKARYLKMLYQHSEGSPDSRYLQVASEIGSRRDTVRKNLDALAAYEVVESHDFFDIQSLDEDKFQFGTFYTALGITGIAAFTGARDDSDQPTHPIENPQSLKVDAIKEIVEWMFVKNEDGKTRLGESRNIPKLAAVVSVPRALERFRDGATLDDAHLDTPDIQNEFIREIRTALHHIKSANSKLNSVDGKDLDVQQVISEIKFETDRLADKISP